MAALTFSTAEAMQCKLIHHTTTVLAVVWLAECGSQLQSSCHSQGVIIHVEAKGWHGECLQPGTIFHSFGGQEAGTSSVVGGCPQKGISSCCHSGLIPGSLAVGSWGTRRGGGHCDPNSSTPVLRPGLGSWHSATSVVKCHVQGPLNLQLRPRWQKEQAGLHCGPLRHHTWQEVMLGTRLNQWGWCSECYSGVIWAGNQKPEAQRQKHGEVRKVYKSLGRAKAYLKRHNALCACRCWSLFPTTPKDLVFAMSVSQRPSMPPIGEPSSHSRLVTQRPGTSWSMVFMVAVSLQIISVFSRLSCRPSSPGIRSTERRSSSTSSKLPPRLPSSKYRTHLVDYTAALPCYGSWGRAARGPMDHTAVHPLKTGWSLAQKGDRKGTIHRKNQWEQLWHLVPNSNQHLLPMKAVEAIFEVKLQKEMARL